MRTLIRLCLFIFCLWVLNGCEKALPEPLKIGTNKWIGYRILYLAQSLRLFDQRSLKLIEMPSATTVARALRNETLDVAALTLDEALTLMQYRSDLRIILVIDRSVGADALLAKPGIDSLVALKGRRVGVENSAVGAILVDAALRAGKLKADDIKLEPVAESLHEQYYLNDKVDALVTFEPYKSRLIAAGARNLFDSSDMPGLIMDVLVARTSVIQQREAELRMLINAHFAALQHFHLHNADAMSIIAANLGISPDDVPKQLEGITIPDLAENRRLLQGKPPGLKTKMDHLASLMRERRLLFVTLDGDNLLDGRLLP